MPWDHYFLCDGLDDIEDYYKGKNDDVSIISLKEFRRLPKRCGLGGCKCEYKFDIESMGFCSYDKIVGMPLSRMDQCPRRTKLW